MSQPLVISLEASRSKKPSLLNVGYTCTCTEFVTVRVPKCSCSGVKGISPLLQVRWKRLVRDEGHNAASQSTELNRFLRIISAERRWIISGTPTTNLLGLSFGSSSEPMDTTVTRNGSETPLSSSPSSTPDLDTSAETGEPTEGAPPRYVNRFHSSRDDLRKLGVMLSDFLGVLPFANSDAAFNNLVVNGLMAKDGPLPGSVRVLEQVMSANMVRHRIEDVERHVKLPHCQEEVVLLDLTEHSQMMYNILLAGVVVNAVDSERVDQVSPFQAIIVYASF